MDPENDPLKDAIEATADLWLRSLPQHVKVGPMPAGPISPATLRFHDLEPRATTFRHFINIIYEFDGPINQLGPILRDGVSFPRHLDYKSSHCQMYHADLHSCSGKWKDLHRQTHFHT